MSDLEKLFKQSNAILFDQANIDTTQVKDILVARLNLAKSINITESNNSDFDNLIKSLEYSIENSDDLMALSLINKINTALITITESFENMSTIINKNLKK